MPKKLSKLPIRNAIVISDTHGGCKLSLMHPDGARLDEENIVYPSPLQRKLWSHWEYLWGEWVPRVTHGEPFTLIHNGDVMDGVHHQGTTQWSHNLTDQKNHCEKILKPAVDLAEGRYHQIRGTEAHVGKSACEEESLAKSLGAIPNEHGQYARWELWMRLGGSDGPLCHFLHHIGNTSSAQHETSALNAEYAAICTDCARWGREPPLIVCRSHRHRCSEVRLPAHRGYATVFVTACWQLKTPFTWKIAGARVTTPQIGASLIRVGDEESHTRHCIIDIERGKVVET